VIALQFGFGSAEQSLWLLVFAMTRIGAALLAAPLFGAVAVPMQLRVAVSCALAVLAINWLPVAAPPALLSLDGLLAVLGEVAIGLSLGFVLQLAFAAPIVAAETIGGSMGMGIATTADPASGAHSPALGQYFTVLLIVIFLGTGGHLQFIALIMRSYEAFPPGSAWFSGERMEQLVGFGGTLFATAVAIALPVTMVLLVVQVVTGVLSRSAPALNLFALGLPAGVLAGIAALILAAPLVTDRLAQLSAEGIELTAQVLAR
jgi:flagellar biosynthetic protein FliR